MRRLLAAAIAAGVLAATLLVGAGPATSGSTTIPFHARIGHILGMIPPLSAAGGAISNNAPASGSLDYNGGPVMPTSKVYTIFWQPPGYQLPAGYANNMNQYFKDLQATSGSNTNTYVNLTQYTQQQGGAAPQYIQNRTTSTARRPTRIPCRRSIPSTAPTRPWRRPTAGRALLLRPPAASPTSSCSRRSRR